MGSITTAALALVDRLNEGLAVLDVDEGTPAIRATLDPAAARTGALARAGVLLGPPVYTWDGTLAGGADVTWTVTVAARPCPGVLQAWDVIDDVITALQAVVELARAVPGQLNTPDGTEPLPAYVLTLDPTTIL